MDPAVRSLLREVRLLQLISQKRAEGFLMGAWHSCFKGNGMEFDEVRPYQPGDDVRSIDWNVTARHGTPYTKTFQEERQLEVYLFCDISLSMETGGGKESKRKLLAKLVALLEFSAEKNRDKVGGVLFSDKIEKMYPLSSDKTSLYKMVRDVLAFKGKGKKSSLTQVLEHANKVLKKPAIIFILSDFLFPCELVQLLRLGRRHTLFGIQISDPWDLAVPNIGVVLGKESENASLEIFDTTSLQEKEERQKRSEKALSEWKSAFIGAGGRHAVLKVGGPLWQPLKKLLTKRVQ